MIDFIFGLWAALVLGIGLVLLIGSMPTKWVDAIRSWVEEKI